MWIPRGIPLLFTGLPPGLYSQRCTGGSAQFPQADSSTGPDLPGHELCPVDSSRTPCQVLEESSSCPRIRSDVGRVGWNRGTTRGRLEDGCWTTSGGPQTLPVHPRDTPRTSPRRHPLSAAETSGVHRIHSPYYYLDFSSRDLFFKTGGVETRLGSARCAPAPSTPERTAGRSGTVEDRHPKTPEGRRWRRRLARVRFGVGRLCQTSRRPIHQLP